MFFPALPSAIQDSLSPPASNRAPSVNAVNAAIALLAPLLSPALTGTPTAPTAAPGDNTTQIATTAFVTAAVTAGGGGGGGGGAVASVFGRTGVVTAQNNDYSFAQIGSKPTTLSGYGIVDAAPLVHVGAGGGAHADVVESGASGFMTGAQAAKLAGIAANATANSSNATLLARANHTGTQAASTIQDFAEAVDDRVGALLVAGANVTLNYNDGAGTLTISATGGGGGGGTLADGNYTDVTASSDGTVITINPGAVTLAKMADVPTSTLLGRDTAGSGVPEQLTVTGGLEFTGSGGIQTAAFTGDVTKSAGGTALSIAAAAVTYAKMQNIASDTLIGRDTASSGAPEAITLNATLEFTGTQSIQRAALTGDVTAGAGSNVTSIAAGAVTLAMMANLAQDQFIGRTTASTGVPQTATITAAARTVLDDTTVAAMVNTLGGGTSTGTGVLVRANTPSLVTPDLGAATATSVSIGGGTALTTTNRTGTGNLVLATDPTLTRLVTSGIMTSDGANVTTANAMGALAIDVTKGLNTKSISTDSSFTFSGTPATNQTWFGMLVTNTDSSPHILTFPSSFDMGAQVARTTCPIAASGKLYLIWNFAGSGVYNLFGASGYLNKYDATSAPAVGDDIADGFGPGSLWLNTTSNLAYICESNSAGAAVWNVLGGGISDADYGDVTVSGGVWTIDNGVVSMAKLANIATDSLIGRDASGTGVPTAISVGGGIEFSGSNGIRRSALTGDVIASAGSNATTIDNGVVTLAKLAVVATERFLGRVSASTGVVEALTGTQATTLLDVFTTSLKGLVPPSGGGTSNFMRADGTWAAPAGGGTVTNTGGNLTANYVVLGAGTTDTKVAGGFATDGTSKMTLGVAGASVGGLLMANATSGTVELRPVTGALGTAVVSVPAVTGTLYISGGTDVAVADGGTGLSSGTSGGVLAYTASGTLASSAALTNNGLVLGGGAGAVPKVAAGLATDGTSQLQLGVAGSSVGSVQWRNATSGTITLSPPTGALGTVALVLPGTAGTLATAAQTVGLPAYIEAPTAKSYRILIKSRFAWTANEITVRTESGTCTVQATINGTNMTGGSQAASSTEASSTITAANAVAAGDDVEIVVSSVSSPVGLQVNIGGTRTLA